MKRDPALLKRASWARDDEIWRGHFEGKTVDTNVTVLFVTVDEIGGGAPWHVHPYDELFIVQEGRALFTIGDKKFEAEAGDLLLGPAKIPHKFTNIGPGRLVTTDIHLNDEWIQENLPDPDLVG